MAQQNSWRKQNKLDMPANHRDQQRTTYDDKQTSFKRRSLKYNSWLRRRKRSSCAGFWTKKYQNKFQHHVIWVSLSDRNIGFELHMTFEFVPPHDCPNTERVPCRTDYCVVVATVWNATIRKFQYQLILKYKPSHSENESPDFNLVKLQHILTKVSNNEENQVHMKENSCNWIMSIVLLFPCTSKYFT